MSTFADGRFVEVELAHIHLNRAGRAVLRDVSWNIRAGERWILAGANGAGKTQLLKLVAGSIWPTPGAGTRRYRWRGELWSAPAQVQEEIAYIGAERQDKYERYAWNHTVRQVIGTGLQRSDIPLSALQPADERRINTLLRRLAIEPLAQRSFLSLSYGERRLALLARALAAEPRLLLLDEWLNGVDAPHRQGALIWLERSGRSRLPWVLATHRLEDVPRSATHAIVLARGRVVFRGRLKDAVLARWLSTESRARTRRPRPHRPGDARRPIVTLARASVYLDERPVLQGISLTVRPGESWVVHGPNGSGKTTLLRTLYGDYGVALGGGIERAGITAGVPLEIFRRAVGLVAPHLQAQYPQDLSVEAVVQGGCRAALALPEPASGEECAAARRALATFALTGLRARRLRELSYGQLRRVLFARACVNEPRLLLLDEPFAGVDARTRRTLQRCIARCAARGTAIVTATHHRAEWPAQATHELELGEGRMRYCGPLRAADD